MDRVSKYFVFESNESPQWCWTLAIKVRIPYNCHGSKNREGKWSPTSSSTLLLVNWSYIGWHLLMCQYRIFHSVPQR